MYAIGNNMYTPYITVIRHDTATYRLHDTATYRLHDTATYRLHDTATYRLHDTATYRLHNTATYRLHDTATYRLHDTATYRPDITHQSQNQGYSNTNTVSVTEPFQVSLTQSRSQVSTNSS